ncbi:MAG: primosomal protein N' (replication factor Y) - superfamily II helicase [Shimia sp.]
MLDAQPTEDHRFPCPSCGSDLRFDPNGTRLECNHCGYSEEIEDGPRHNALAELDYHRAVADQLPRAEIEVTQVVQCNSCGAQVEFEPDTHAAECPFCASPVVTDTGAHRHIKPKGLLPFALQEAQARDAMTEWLGSLWFAPNGLQDYARKGRRMSGIYVPYWTFDADTKSEYRGERGDDYYVNKTVVRNGKRETVRVRKTRWRRASGRVARFFDDVLVLASTSLPQRFTKNLEPWDLSELRPYAPEYLAGFRAEGYSVELEEGFEHAKVIMNRVIERDVRFDIGGDRQRIHDLRTEVRDVTFKHILLPVWLAAYKYRGRTFRFVVNGRTGAVQGERPWSAWKIAFAVILGALVAGAIGFLYAATS